MTRQVRSAAIHPVCAIHHFGLVEELQALGSALAERAVTPIYATCCAFAGDRGFLHPELTKSATQEQVEELKGETLDRNLCSNRNCEIGMNLATGREYQSVVLLLEELTREV